MVRRLGHEKHSADVGGCDGMVFQQSFRRPDREIERGYAAAGRAYPSCTDTSGFDGVFYVVSEKLRAKYNIVNRVGRHTGAQAAKTDSLDGRKSHRDSSLSTNLSITALCERKVRKTQL